MRAIELERGSERERGDGVRCLREIGAKIYRGVVVRVG